MRPFHLLHAIVLCFATIYSTSISAQLKVDVEAYVYDRFLVVTGDNVNFRKSPSTKSARLMLGQSPETEEMEALHFSDEYRAEYDRPEQGFKGQVLPLVGSASGWFKSFKANADHIGRIMSQKEFWISSQFSKPTKIRKNVPLRTTMNCYYYPDATISRDFIHRQSGKFRNLVFSADITAASDANVITVYISFPCGDGVNFIHLSDRLIQGEASPSKAPMFERSTTEDGWTGEELDLTTMNIGKKFIEDGGPEHLNDVLDTAINMLLECSDEEFEDYLVKNFIAKAKGENYQVIFFVEGNDSKDSDYEVQPNISDAPGSRRMRTTIDFTNNVGNQDPDAI